MRALAAFSFAVLAAAAIAPAQGNDTMVARRNHWAWQPLREVSQPTVAAKASRHPVDAFTHARLQAAGLAPSPQADAATLLRRLWFDLVGLPPTPAAIERFGDRPSTATYLAEVERLLASPRFGERWARHWLDLMRYCETLGHEYDFEVPNAWRYRDYVIRSFNDDVPYDQFVREHIAGDLLLEPRRDADGNNESVQATASWWFVEQTHSPVDAMQHQADRVDNQLDVFSKAFLGMTVACARCHDHKFDAIPTRDYYSLFGYVQSSRYVQAPLQPVSTRSDEYQRVLKRQRDLVRAWQRDLPEVAIDSDPGVTLRDDDLVVADASDPRGWYLTNDGFGMAPWRGAFCTDPDVDEPLLHHLPGPFWTTGPVGGRREGTIATRTFGIEQRHLHVRVAGRDSRVKVIVDGFHVVRDPIYGALHKKVHRDEAHWLTFDLQMWRGRQAYVQVIDQRAPDLGDPHHNRGHYPETAWVAVQSVVLSPHGSPPETAAPPAPVAADAASTRGDWRAARARLAKAMQSLPVSPTLPALADGSGIDSYVYLRGSHRQQGETAPRAFLSALPIDTPDAPSDRSGRLQLADAVLAPENPLPARVLVNRLWHHLFGRGLVKSVDNLGALGEQPTHPELLDWLARDFVANGWSVKHAIRRIVTSATYRQQSRQRRDAAERDPNNELLHRQNVRALEAEILRDSLLAVSGRIDLTMYGPSIEQPAEEITKARGRPKRHAPRDGHGRRSVYLAMRRNFMPQLLLAFDLPTPFATVGRRNRSNVPAQALALANATLVHELCERFADRVLAHSDNDAQRLQLAYRLCFARVPTAGELERLLAFVRSETPRPPAEQRAVWIDCVHALVNTTEFRFRR